MGCPKITYDYQEEGLEKSTVHFFGQLAEKRGQQKNRINYYPFGLTFNESYRTASVPNKFKYNSFEFMDDLNLNLYDYQARYYDPAIGRFIQIDPAVEISISTSPYSYAFNNPIRFVDFDGMVGEEGGATDPKKLYGKQIDMSSAPGRTNAAGHPRNGPWFWRKMLENHPEMFSDDNVKSIRSGKSPIVDGKWLEHNPAHADYKGGKLIHHHIDQGKMATGIPDAAHKKHFSKLHANRGGRPKGTGKVGGLLGFATTILDIYKSIDGDPHSLGMQFRKGKEDNKLYYDDETEQYFEVTNRSDVTDEDGNVIGSEVTYNTYDGYRKNEETGKYEGVNKTGTYKAIKYTGDAAKKKYEQLLKKS